MSKIRKRMGLTERSGSILFIEFLPGGMRLPDQQRWIGFIFMSRDDLAYL